MGACSSLGSRIGSAKASAPDPVGISGRRGSRSLAKSPSSGGPLYRKSQEGTSRRSCGMSFRTAFNKSRRKASGMPNATTAMATVSTRPFCQFSFVDSVRIRSSAVSIDLGLRELHITVDTYAADGSATGQSTRADVRICLDDERSHEALKAIALHIADSRSDRYARCGLRRWPRLRRGRSRLQSRWHQVRRRVTGLCRRMPSARHNRGGRAEPWPIYRGSRIGRPFPQKSILEMISALPLSRPASEFLDDLLNDIRSVLSNVDQTSP